MNLITNFADKLSLFTKSEKIRMINLQDLIVDPEFKAIFPQKETDIQNLQEDMKNHGYDTSHPIIVSKGTPGVPDYTVVDGHTRQIVVETLGIKSVPYIEKQFENRNAIIDYIYRIQMNRRNLTEQEKFSYFQKLSAQKDENGRQIKNDEQIAKDLEVSPRQVSKMKEVEKKASVEILESFKNGDITLNKAYNQMKEETGIKHKTQNIEKVIEPTQSDETKVDSVAFNSSEAKETELIKKGFQLAILYTTNVIIKGGDIEDIIESSQFINPSNPDNNYGKEDEVLLKKLFPEAELYPC